MTTIAWDGNQLACDSQTTQEDTVISLNSNKLFTEVGDFDAVVGAGNPNQVLSAIAWLQGEKKVPSRPTGDWVLIGVIGKQAYHLSDSSDSARELTGPYANGTGAVVAMTAMKLGKSAKEAVELACELDIYTGGEVKVWECRS